MKNFSNLIYVFATFLIASTLSPDSRDNCVADINNTENLKDEPLPF